MKEKKTGYVYLLTNAGMVMIGRNTKHIAPGNYWYSGDRLLDDIYDETYPIVE